MNDTKSDMISGELYQPFLKELYNDRLYCKSLCHELNNLFIVHMAIIFL